jgi:2-C-methyl-D-erythritol 2,4-cyclodiphosphate synthase
MSIPPAGYRVGWGFDAHRLEGSPPLLLGGVTVSTTLGVSATSDGDVLAHAIADALLGAAGLGDLGDHFPSDQPSSRGADSMFLLRQIATMSTGAGWVVGHVDATVVTQEPRLAPFRDEIRKNVASAVGTSVEQVSIKATTTDGLGFIGRGEGIAAVSLVTVAARP